VSIISSEAKSWAKEKLAGIITVCIPTFTQDMKDLNEKAIEHDIKETASHGFLGTSIVTEAWTTQVETKRFMQIATKFAKKEKLITSLLTTFSTIDETFEMVKYAKDVGIDLIQLGFPSMWHPLSLQEVLNYTCKVCELSSLPTVLWAANMWGWTELLEDPNNYPRELLLKFAEIPNIVGIKSGSRDPSVLKEVYSKGVVPSHPGEHAWPMWIRMYGARWGGISAYNHFYYAPEYFGLLLKGDWNRGMELYFKMAPLREVWSQMMTAEIGSDSSGFGWTGHNRLRWKYAGWLVGLNGGPFRGWYRLSKQDMIRLRKAALASGIPVTKDDDSGFFEGRNPS
jgi:4-hydroxy-tetrahydrodipicolinate synthase